MAQPKATVFSLILALSALAYGACVTVKPVNVSHKTTLESQLIGELEPLTEEEVLASSVRASGGLDDSSHLHHRAVFARRRQMFNRDDIQEFKQWGCLGEAPNATLALRACEQITDHSAPQLLLRRLHMEENADRQTVIDWAIATDPMLTPADRQQIVAVYHRLLLEQLRPGDWLQTDNGTWQQR